MRRFRKVHMVVALVALVAALSALMASPVSAQTPCAGATAGDIDDDVIVAAFCGVTAGDTINGNVTLAAGAFLEVFGTVNGNIDATAGAVVSIANGPVNGNIEGGPNSFVSVAGTVNGNIEVTSPAAAPSVIQLLGGFNFPPSATLVKGNVIHNGPGGTFFFGGPNTGVLLAGIGGFGVTVEGNIEAENGAGVENITFCCIEPHTVTGDIKCNGVAGDDLGLFLPNMNVLGNRENCDP